MSKFIKLTNLILNSNHIQKILITQTKYYIYINDKNIDGSNWVVAGFGIGNISSHASTIEVCQIEDAVDYKIVSDWINKIQ